MLALPPARLALAALGLVTLVGCGGSAPEPVTAREARREPRAPLVVSRPGTIARAELDAVLERGPGAFLARLAVEPELEAERFVGFRITELRDPALFGSGELRAGDVVVSINAHAIERPDDAFEIWSALRVASELAVRLVRDGEPVELRYPIVD